MQTKDLHHDFIVENIIGDQKVSGDRASECECLALLQLLHILHFSVHIYKENVVLCEFWHHIAQFVVFSDDKFLVCICCGASD